MRLRILDNIGTYNRWDVYRDRAFSHEIHYIQSKVVPDENGPLGAKKDQKERFIYKWEGGERGLKDLLQFLKRKTLNTNNELDLRDHTLLMYLIIDEYSKHKLRLYKEILEGHMEFLYSQILSSQANEDDMESYESMYFLAKQLLEDKISDHEITGDLDDAAGVLVS